MNRVTELIEEIKMHVDVLDRPTENSPRLNLIIEELGDELIRTNDPVTEKFLSGLLQVKNCHTKFAVLCALLKAQRSGLEFRNETLEQLDGFEKSKDLFNACICRSAKKRISAEQSTA